MFPFIKSLIESGKISSSMGRLLEYALLSVISYLLGILVSGEVFSVQALIVSVVSPLLAWFSKLQRDASEELKALAEQKKNELISEIK